MKAIRKVKKHRFLLIAGIAISTCALASTVLRRTAPSTPGFQATTHAPRLLSELLILSKSAQFDLDVARINLLCVGGLPGSGSGDLGDQIKTLDDWAQRIASETARHSYRYSQNPKEFNSSEGYFRMLMMSVVLAEDFHVQYDPTLQTNLLTVLAPDGFFASASSVFLPGLLGPERKGTCSSLPVLYVAIGRRLGYPLHLVTTKGHLFVRWDGKGERFNIETTSHGLNTFDDDYYRNWPFPITAEEEKAEGYLKNLDTSGELAVFLSIRGMCLRDNGRVSEAADAFAKAAELAPYCRSYRAMRDQLTREAQIQRGPVLTINKITSP
jgi:hypothetical protein